MRQFLISCRNSWQVVNSTCRALGSARAARCAARPGRQPHGRSDARSVVLDPRAARAQLRSSIVDRRVDLGQRRTASCSGARVCGQRRAARRARVCRRAPNVCLSALCFRGTCEVSGRARRWRGWAAAAARDRRELRRAAARRRRLGARSRGACAREMVWGGQRERESGRRSRVRVVCVSSIFHSEWRRGGCDETAASCACVRRIISEHHSNASSLTRRYSLCCSGVRRFGPWKQQETPPSARAASSTPAGYRSAYLKRAPWRAAVRAAATTDAPGHPLATSNRRERCPGG